MRGAPAPAEAAPPGFAPGRAPLEGLPERLLAGLRAAGAWLCWAAALLLPLALLRELGPRVTIEGEMLRHAAALTLYLVAAWLLHRLGGGLLARLHVSRSVRLEAEGLRIGARRRLGMPTYRLEGEGGEVVDAGWSDEAPGEGRPAGLTVPFSAIQRLFRVELSAGGHACLGLWYVGGDGRAREIWLPLGAQDADRLQERITRATGERARRPGARETSPREAS